MKHVPRSSYLLAATVFSASLLGLAMAVALPFFLAPAEYAHFSLNLALVQLVTSVAFEWVRVSVLRHGGGEQEGNRELRSNLRALFTIVGLLLLALAATLGMLSIWIVELRMSALVCAIAAAQGAFEGRSAWARANFDNIRLSIAAFARPALSLILVIGFAMETRSGTWALAGLCISYPLSSLFFRDRISAIVAPLTLDRATSLSLLRFGVMAALGTNFAMAVPAALRSVIVGVLGLSGAGGVLLALDIGQRVFSTTGMALNLLHFQTLVRVIDTQSMEDASRKARAVIAIAAALFVGIVVALVSAAASIGAVLAPGHYEQDFVRHLPIFAVLMAILCLRQFTVDALFIAFRKVAFIAVAPAVTLALFGLTFLSVHIDLVAVENLYALLVAAGAIGFLVPFVFIRGFLPGAVPYDAFVASVVAAGIAIGFSHRVGVADPILSLALQAITSLGIYAAMLAALALLQGLWRRWRAPILRGPERDAQAAGLDTPTGK